VNKLAALLADIHVALAVATNERESLAAVMRYVETTRPQSIQLNYMILDGQGRPIAVEMVAHWRAGEQQVSATSSRRCELKHFPVSELFIANPHELVALEDVENDPRCDPYTRKACLDSGQRAMVILPLFSITHEAWQGVISILWAEPHSVSAEERFVYSMLMATVASFLANRRSERALREALKERQTATTQFREMLEHMPVGVLMVEVPSGRPQLANRMAVELLGRIVDPQAGKGQYSETYKCFRPGTDEPLPDEELPLVRTMHSGQLEHGEIDIMTPDGKRRLLDATAAPMRDEAGQVRNAVVLFFDISERKRAEQERQRMQEELISMQAAALAERSTPLIPITDEIVVVPLIGSLDAERGNQLMDTLLHGVTQSHARVAIIDITGIRTLDTQAASTLTGAAQALRLLGVEPVLTGIRAEVAQTLVSLGVRLDGIATRNNLQSGISLALKYTGQKTLK